MLDVEPERIKSILNFSYFHQVKLGLRGSSFAGFRLGLNNLSHFDVETCRDCLEALTLVLIRLFIYQSDVTRTMFEKK